MPHVRTNRRPLPFPTPDEATKFQCQYLKHIRKNLSPEEAERTLSELVQFFFMTRGHEWVRQRDWEK